MQSIRLYYWLDMPNFGDALNIDVCEKLFGIKPIKTTPEECEASFLGSTLDDFLFKGISFFNKKYRRYHKLPPVKIWGSGFITAKNEFCKRRYNLPEQYFRKAEVYAVRGELSRERLINIKDVTLKTDVVADPGLLASDLCNNTEKKYTIGIIPHHIEEDMKIFDCLNEKIDGSIIIKMSWDTDVVLKLISECRYILSSAMHGLITADSFGIPNMQLVASDKLIGGMYKFNDYYSSYGITEREVLNVSDLSSLSMKKICQFIESNYVVNYKEVERKKESLYDSFPFR